MQAGIRLAIIGMGNMGRAIARGVTSAGLMPPAAVLAIDVDSARLAEVKGSLGLATSPDPAAARNAPCILLAVKPQVFGQVSGALGELPRPALVITIMAGLSSSAIRRALGENARVVRVMPNMPAQMGAGMAAIAPGAGALAADQLMASEIFNALGRTVMVEEGQMHAVTAVSGSGPAYVFLLAEAMERAAVELGLPPATARQLVEQTVLGAGRLLAESNEGAEQLRRAVTSPGGTTAAALDVMFENQLPQIVVDALRAARDRGVDLDRA